MKVSVIMISLNFIVICYFTSIDVGAETSTIGRNSSNHESLTGDTDKREPLIIQETDFRYDAFKQVAEQLNKTMNLTLDPCNEFYEFTCGNYDGYGTFAEGTGFNIDEAALQLEDKEYLISKAPAAVQKLAKVYELCRSENASEYSNDEDFLRSVIDEFKKKTGLDFTMIMNQNDTDKNTRQTIDKDILAKALTALSVLNIDTLISPHVSTDWGNSSSYILQLRQTELYLPYYSYDDKRWSESAAEYKRSLVQHLNQTAALYSINLDQQRLSDDVDVLMQFEKDLAQNYTVRRDFGDPAVYKLIYNVFKVKDIREKYPFLNFDYYLANLAEKLPELETYFDDERSIVINEPELLERLNNHFADMNHDLLANYFYIRLVSAFPVNYKTAVSRSSEEMVRRRCIFQVSFLSSDIMTRAYLDRFHPDKVERDDLLNFAMQTAEKVREKVAAVIGNLSWMDDTVKNFNIKKVMNVNINVGYEREIDDDHHLNELYDHMDFQENASYISMMQTFLSFNRRSYYKRMSHHQNLHKNQFQFSPVFVYGSYMVDTNTLHLSIGFIDRRVNRNWPSSLIYGSLGSAVAHEFVHAFTSKNTGFDFIGMLADETLVKTSKESFSNISNCLINQYNSYCAFDSESNDTTCTNGKATLTENLADIIGLNAAWIAYNDQKSTDGADLRLPDSVFSQFSNDQLFFIWYGHSWCQSRSIFSDYLHAPPKFRVIGPLHNHNGFRETFQCNVPSRHAPQQQCQVTT